MYALEDCGKVMFPNEIPCKLVSSWNYTPQCENHSGLVYTSNGSTIDELNFSTFGQSQLCVANFTISTVGSYEIVVSNGDSADIKIEQEDTMLANILTVGGLIAYFIIMGFLAKGALTKFFAFAVSLIETIFMVGLMYIGEAGGSLVGLLRMNFYIVGIIGFGIGIIALYSLTATAISPHNVGQDDKKWSMEDKWT